MGKLKDIYVGWKNYLFGDEETNEMAEKRVAICEDCFDENGKPMVQYAIKPISLYLHCRSCWCHIPAAARSPEKKCPLGKW